MEGSADGHDHSHGHSHDHEGQGHADHNSEPDSRRAKGMASSANGNLAEARANQRKLKRATIFVLVFFVVEVIGGVWSGSLAIISDAAHLLADVSGFILAMVANEIASRPACDKLTYGPVRAEVLSALFSTVTILVLSLLLVFSAIVRIFQFSRGEGEEIDGRMMSIIALLGLVVNLALLGIFGHEHAGHDHSHGHSHGHDENHEHGNSHNAGGAGHDEEEGLMRRQAGGAGGRATVGEGERASLVHNASVDAAAAGSPGNGLIDVRNSGESSVNSASGGQDRYGSLEEVAVGGAGEGRGAALVVGEGAFDGKPLKKEKNINMEAAVLHAVTDLVQSAGVLLAGLLIWYDPRWKWADPIATLFFVGLVVNSTRWLLKRAFNVLLEGVPDSIDYERLRRRLSEIEGVTDLHCLHVWSLTLGRTVVSAHIKATEPDRVLASAHEICEDMGVAHSTIQVQMDHCVPESCTHPCVSAVGKCCGPDGGSPRSVAPEAIPSREAS